MVAVGNALQDQAVRPLQTLRERVAALREEDYSFRARGAAADDALGELSIEVNALADLLADQRIRAIEATALLRRVVEEIDIPLFAFDPDHNLRAGKFRWRKVSSTAFSKDFGRTAEDIGLTGCFAAENEALVPLQSKQSHARWLVRRSTFRQKGVPHTLIVFIGRKPCPAGGRTNGMATVNSGSRP